MLKFLLKNLAFMIVTILAVSFIVFMLNEASPGDVAKKILGQFALPEQVEALRKEMRLDRPVLVRYFEFMGNLASGDLGFSHRYQAPVSEILWPRLKNTIILAALAFAIVVPLSIVLGTFAAINQRSRLDRAIVVFGTIMASIPEFAMSVFLIGIFVVGLGVLPGTSGGLTSGQWSFAATMALPVSALVLFILGYLVVMVRSSVVDTLNEPFVRTAVLKGLKYRRVVIRHVLPNALITPITVILLQINYLITGVVVVETIFAYPGFGRLMLDAAQFQDVAVIETGAMVAVFVVVSTQVLSDLAYNLMDPKVRL